MKNLFSYILRLLVIISSLTSNSLSQEIVLGSEVQKNHVTADGQGLYMDILRAIYQPQGYTIKLKIIPMKRFIPEAREKNVDGVIGSYAVSELQAIPDLPDFINPKYPIDTEVVVAVCRKELNKSWQQIMNNPESRYAWVRGYEYDYLLGIPKNMIVNNPGQAIKMLNSKRLDCLVDNLQFYLNSLQSAELDRQSFTETTLDKKNLYIIFRNSEKHQRLAEQYDQGMQTLIDNGLIYYIFEKWGRHFKEIDLHHN